MINLLIGSSGSGKSYEAAAFHVLAAVSRGRMVITNMPLNVAAYAAIDPAYAGLIELRKKPLPVRGKWSPTREEGAFEICGEEFDSKTDRVFSGVWDYYTEWRHPETKQGPLFVVDEAQNVIPFRTCDVAVEEWAALHRHWVVDVIFITQSYGKLSQAVRDNVQMVYRCRKKVAWGQPNKYIRKVQDGIRGEVLNVTEREYNSKYFGLYRSHTQGSAGDEAMADDVKPWWKHWTFVGAAVMVSLSMLIFIFGGSSNPLKPKAPVAAARAPEKKIQPSTAANSPVAAPAPVAPAVEAVAHPYAGRTFHILGTMARKGVRRYVFAVAQNGQKVSDVTSAELEQLGYKIRPGTDCAAQVAYEKWSNWIICDAPQVGPMAAGSDVSSGSRKL